MDILSYINTTETDITIIELESNTCYIFGVGVYSSHSTVSGDCFICIHLLHYTVITTNCHTS